MSRPTQRFPDTEWDFATVPEAELTSCLFYEYARESPSIRQTLDGPFPAPEYLIVNGRRIKISSFFRRSAMHNNLRRYALPVLLAVRAGKKTLAEPWQAKRRAARRAVAKAVAAFHPPVSEGLVKPLARISCLADHGLWSAATRCTGLDPESGSERLLIQIHWGDFTDTEILDYLRVWIKASRPHGIGRHSEKGRGPADLRARLDWLGIMRLLARFPHQEALRRAESAGRFLGTSELDWRKKKSAALAFFHELFHFLPEAEKPLSAAPFRARAKYTVK